VFVSHKLPLCSEGTKAEGTQEEDIMSNMEEGLTAGPSRTFELHHCCSNHAATLAQKVSDDVCFCLTRINSCATQVYNTS